MAGERRQLLKALEAMQAANDELRQELARHKRATAQAIKRAQDSSMTPHSILGGGAPDIRVELTEAIDRFEKARHQSRLAIFAFMGTKSSSNTAEVGRSLGISRQLASRLAREAARGPKR